MKGSMGSGHLENSLDQFPNSQAADLGLVTPTKQELETIDRLTFPEWGDALTLPQYLEEADLLTEWPLARDGGMRPWILTCRDQCPNRRPILASCETFHKRAFVLSKEGVLSESFVYGIASVFVRPDYRNRGYGTRLMQGLARLLPEMQSESSHAVGSVLFSDIGKQYYARLGWKPSVGASCHIQLDPWRDPVPYVATTRSVRIEGLASLCQEDERLARNTLAAMPPRVKRMMIAPDIDHMLWHINKESFACLKLFGKEPEAKGAIVGESGNRVWVVWVRRYYTHPDRCPNETTLYVLRLVLENQSPAQEELDSQVQNLKAVLQACQAEAARWGLQSVKLWHPTPLVQELLQRSKLEHRLMEREESGIASLQCFGDEMPEDIDWCACEKYTWM